MLSLFPVHPAEWIGIGVVYGSFSCLGILHHAVPVLLTVILAGVTHSSVMQDAASRNKAQYSVPLLPLLG